MTRPDRQHAFLRRVMQRTGWTQTELAARAGLDPSTLSRFLSGGREGHALRSSTIRKIEKVSGIAAEPAAETAAGGQIAHQPGGFGEAEAIPLQIPSGSNLTAVVAALAEDRPNTDPWVLKSRALESAGYLPGDILIVALGEIPLSGDVVCAQIYDWTAGKAETVFRIFQPPYLVAACSDLELMRPHVVDSANVQIKGVVINAIRNRAAGKIT